MRRTREKVLAMLLVGGMALGASGYTLTGNSWGTGATVTYSFDRLPYGYTVDETAYGGGVTTTDNAFTTFGGVWNQDIIAAFDTWADATGLTFEWVLDTRHDFDAAGAAGEIRCAVHVFDGPGGEYAHAFPPPPLGVSAAGDVHFDSEEEWHIGAGAPGPGEYDLYSVALHEVGHALGLGDSLEVFSVMSSDYWYNADRELSADDIAGAQAVYGEDSGPTPEPETWLVMVIFLTVAVFVRRTTCNSSDGTLECYS